MKPGKPTTFATCMFLGKKKYFLCLPGNPVSALVTARLFLLPLLNEMHGNFSGPVISSVTVRKITFVLRNDNVRNNTYKMLF